uniref:La-related protein 7 n=1 Tax=Amblyomma maculatum TaxID=34609 RepID=G3MLP4_AMBMU
MEFYFSDANLRKDRFMNELVHRDEEGYVDLEVFLTFHKIRALTADVKDIAGAITTSNLLQMDEEHRRVRRCTALETKPDVDECTLYVERLPPHADHAWLKGVFSRHGQVVYVSLPRYRHNNRIKGFAFIEFATAEDVDRACQHFGYHDGNSKKPEVVARSTESDDKDIPSMEMEVDDDEPPPAKRRREESMEIVEHEAPSKEAKANEEGAESTSDAESSDTGVDETENGDATRELSMSEEFKKKKKIRKRKKKTPHSETKVQHSLLVMPKCEWKRLRNKYLALQKATMAQIKRSLLLPPSGGTPFSSPSHTFCSPARSLTVDDTAVPEDRQCMEDGQNTEEWCEAPAPTLQFQPGVIVKMLTEKPVSNTSEFKSNIRQLANVAYVDVMEGDSVAYVRCADPEGARQFIENQKESFCGSLSLLAGDEEKSYWDKIILDRETRRSQRTRQKKRGAEKVMAKAQKMMEKLNLHIRFDDL